MSKNTGTSELINYFDLGANGDVGIAGSLDVNTIANATTDTDKFLVSDTGIIKYRTGAELLSDIGAQGALTNPVTGTGTSGTIPVFTGSTTLGNSIIQSNTTQVNVVGNGSQLLFDSLGSAKDGGIQYINDFTLQIYNSRGVGSAIYLGNNNLDFNISPSTNTKLRITSGGNVLIGTTTDQGQRLLVQGTGGTTGFTRFTDGATAAMFIGVNSGTPFIHSNNSTLSFGATGANTFSPTMTLSSGNVGIGTTSVTTNKLVVDGFGNANSIMTYPVAKFYGGGSGGLNIGTDGTNPQIATDSSGVDLTFLTRVSGVFYERMRITSGGNVLIGTTTDSGYKLYVSGNTYLDGTIEGATFSSTAGALTVDANTQFKSGFYRWNDTSTNLPEAGFFAVVIYGNCGNVVAQMATHFTNANTYVRSYNNSWTAWKRLDT